MAVQQPPKQASGYKSREAVVTPEQLRKIRGVQLIVGGLIFIIVPGVELYRRLYIGGERKVQQGTFNPVDGTYTEWSEEEKIRNFKQSWLTRLFGER